LAKPLTNFEAEVKPEWIDLNGHMTFWAYAKLFNESASAYLSEAGISEQMEATQGSALHTAQCHVKYLRESFARDRVIIEFQMLGYDDKCIHIFQRMRNRDTGVVLAVEESVKSNLADQEASPFSFRERSFHPKIKERLALLMKQHEKAPWPTEVGSAIRLPSVQIG
jgi:acyl-CoA thioester hydrolase